VAQFSKTTTVAPSDADTLELVRLPKGAVILSGAVTWTDQDTGAGTLDIGTDDGTADADAIASALDISAAGSSALLEATAFTPIVLDAPTSVFATYNEGTALAVGTIAGYLLYVVNT
jgi:hypothetical protein